MRVGLHTGTPLVSQEGYVGGDVHRAARVAAVGHGGQVLVSAATAELVELELVDLGEHRLKDLSAPEHIYQLGQATFPAVKSLYRTNLPIPSTPFLGREAELAEVASLLASSDTRLVTLTGPGGTGKTRLAAQAAGLASDGYADGVWWIPLAPLRDPTLVLATAAQVVGSKNGLAEHIQDKEMLCLFDNFEQVVEAAADIAELLASCPNLDLLVTSREPLHVTGEQEYSVPPFVHEEGVGFFLARARAVKPDFEADEAVSEICRRLDDLPLALELAAARVKALTSTQILDRLEHRLPLLTGGARDLPERQRTLRATIEWSYDLLNEDERQLFGRLSVFRGGCTLEAAEDVCDADLDTLQSLVDKSLVRFTNGRYWMLETIREFAADVLALKTLERSGARHAAYYLDLAHRAGPELEGPAQVAWLELLDLEQDNLRMALDETQRAGRPDIALEAAIELGVFWWTRAHVDESARRFEGLLAVAQPASLRFLGLRDLGGFALRQGDYEKARRIANERLELSRALNDDVGVHRSLQNLARVAIAEDDLDEARRLITPVVAWAREHPEEGVWALETLAEIEWRAGDFDRAAVLYEEFLAHYEERGDESGVAGTCIRIGAVMLYQGRNADAVPFLIRGMELHGRVGDVGGLAFSLEVIGFAVAAAGDGRTAALLVGAADDLKQQIGERESPARLGPYEQAVRMATDLLGTREFDAAYAAGRALSLDDAVALALEVMDA